MLKDEPLAENSYSPVLVPPALSSAFLLDLYLSQKPVKTNAPILGKAVAWQLGWAWLTGLAPVTGLARLGQAGLDWLAYLTGHLLRPGGSAMRWLYYTAILYSYIIQLHHIAVLDNVVI